MLTQNFTRGQCISPKIKTEEEEKSEIEINKCLNKREETCKEGKDERTCEETKINKNIINNSQN